MAPILILCVLVPIVAAVLVVLNYAMAPLRPVFSKKGTYECGLLSRTSQSRQPFSILFYIVAVLFVVFDLDLVVIYPLVAVLQYVGLYGLWVFVVFFSVLTLGFVIELATGALSFSKSLVPTL